MNVKSHATVCEYHPDRPSMKRVWIYPYPDDPESIDLCEDCLKEHEKAKGDDVGKCEWCGKESKKLRPQRDYDEGMCGPVYAVCPNCVHKASEEARKELDEFDEL